jgi:hypothetical protein
MVSLKAIPSVLAYIRCNHTFNKVIRMGSSVSLFYKNQGLVNNIYSTFIRKHFAAGLPYRCLSYFSKVWKSIGRFLKK